MVACRIRITGLVQGVGFRPTVWRLAQACSIAGTVRNDGAGVLIDAWGSEAALDAFQQQLQTDIPPWRGWMLCTLARWQRLARTPIFVLSPVHPARFILVLWQMRRCVRRVVPIFLIQKTAVTAIPLPIALTVVHA